jgi:hypothetical protein
LAGRWTQPSGWVVALTEMGGIRFKRTDAGHEHHHRLRRGRQGVRERQVRLGRATPSRMSSSQTNSIVEPPAAVANKASPSPGFWGLEGPPADTWPQLHGHARLRPRHLRRVYDQARHPHHGLRAFLTEPRLNRLRIGLITSSYDRYGITRPPLGRQTFPCIVPPAVRKSPSCRKVGLFAAPRMSGRGRGGQGGR